MEFQYHVPIDKNLSKFEQFLNVEKTASCAQVPALQSIAQTRRLAD